MALRGRIKQLIHRLDAGSRSASMESVYQRIFERDLASINSAGIRFYPVGSAANYGLLYILLRAALDYPLGEVLELGAGQTSLLLDLMKKAGVLKSTVRTLEHDKTWADRISASVSHEVITTTLVPRCWHERRFMGYDFSPLPKSTVELLIVDGPPAGQAANRFARLGAVDLVEWINPSRFIIVVDDAERDGELLLANSIQALLKDKNIAHKCGGVFSNKTQIVIAGGDYVGAAYY
ncbi:hypothetical protein JQ615_17300 [Bradyrhizobium jicamae]|uniref:Methyltransferase n=1 Tax=Bradyrhizobium jicamae TaxID=280332 RepID=A0ABS5FK34_9BRAD|nr:hypothetical protein [Bradyrhizobium jicamae]MBR0797151.1 hypothetical protein [Bradyrhizobium jicamae]MBR0934936.1 hypothetical protein [Bradyrhizobium jicamae]